MNQEDAMDDSRLPLPDELANAIEQVRARQASPAMVAKLTEAAIGLGRLDLDGTMPTGRKRSSGRHMWQFVGLAASLLIVLAGAGHWLLVPADRDIVHESLPENVHYSPISESPLTLVGFRMIEADLDRVDETVSEVSAAVELMRLRREIQSTLDDYYDWTEKE